MIRTLDPTPDTLREAAHETLVAGLRNAHALEKQAVAVLKSQLDRLNDYPDLHARISAHIVESREQSDRLEIALEACDASASKLKDVMMSVMGAGQSSVQGFADDAVIKAVLADTMFEHLEIASYRSLLELAEMAGKSELRPRLEESLREEEAMAAWLEENLPAITRRYVEITAGEREATKNPPEDARDAADESGTDTEADTEADVAAIQEETRAREARARATSERLTMTGGGGPAKTSGSGGAIALGDGTAPAGDEPHARSGEAAEPRDSDSGSITPENFSSERPAPADPDAQSDRMAEKAR